MTDLDKELDENIQQLKSTTVTDVLTYPANRAAEHLYQANDIAKQVFVGVADIMGLPKVGADILRGQLGYEQESPFPSATEIQKFMSDFNITYAPGDEPDDISARFWRNIGASGPFIVKGAASTLTREALAALGGATGGKAMQATSWGQKHPSLSRAVGELGGGLGLSSSRHITKSTKVWPFSLNAYRLLTKPFRGAWAKRRAAGRMADVVTDRATAARNYEEALKHPEFEGLTPSQLAGDQGLAKFRKGIEAEIPREAEAGIRQRSEIMITLERRAVAPGADVSDVRRYLEKKFSQLSAEADEAMRKIDVSDEVALNEVAKSKVDEAYTIARNGEKKIWNNLPAAKPSAMPEIERVYMDELANITEGGDLSEISAFVKSKLGKLNKEGKLAGGELLNMYKRRATPKAIHQFYSRMGREIRELSVQKGQTNKIRILNRLRKAALNDLEASAVGENYKEAIRFSRDLNEMFTAGELGKILGFQSGMATPATRFLDDLVGSGDQAAMDGINQALRASPEIKDQITDLIRTRFALAAVKNDRVHQGAAGIFMNKYRRVLNAFPELKDELSTAAQKQSKLDDLMGATKLSETSPLVRQRTAAGVFLGSDPGDEVSRVLKYAKNKGQTTGMLTDLVNEVKKDPTGKALPGLRNAAIGEIMESSRKITDPLTMNKVVSGQAFLTRLNKLGDSFISSGLITSEELGRLRRIGTAFRNVEMEMTAKAGGRIITDKPGVALRTVAAVFGARYGARLGGVSPGGSIQAAGRVAKFSEWIADKITKDEARILLVESTTNKKVMDAMLADVASMSKEEQLRAAQKIVNIAKNLSGRAVTEAKEYRAPAAALVPPLISTAGAPESEALSQRLENEIRMLK